MYRSSILPPIISAFHTFYLHATGLPSLEANSTATRRFVDIVLLNEVVAASVNSVVWDGYRLYSSAQSSDARETYSTPKRQSIFEPAGVQFLSIEERLSHVIPRFGVFRTILVVRRTDV